MLSMICDDDPDWRRAVARALDGRVVHAEDLGSALTQFEHIKPTVLLLDVLLPDGIGWEAIPEFRARSPHTQIIVMTALPRRTDGVRSLGEHRAFAYIDKSDGLETIRRTVRRAAMVSLISSVKAKFEPVLRPAMLPRDPRRHAS